MFRRAIVGLFAVACLGVCGAAALAEAPAALRSRDAGLTLRVVQITNEIRAAHDLPPLQVNAALSHSAEWMAQDMVQHDYLCHTDFQGREIDPRIPTFGYADYSEIGENIAGGQATAEEVVADWMRSPGHRANLLNPTFREIGVAHYQGANTKFRDYWVQDFGTRADDFPVVINNKALRTSDRTVHLYLYGPASAQQMRFSNDGIHWSAWQPYQARSEWKLRSGYGERTVYAEVRAEGIVRACRDSVRLTAGGQSTLLASALTIRAAH